MKTIMEEKVTVDSILDYLKESVEQKIPLPASVWLDAAIKLNVLLADIDDALADAKMAVAEERAELMRGGESAAAAKVYAEASPNYRRYLLFESKRERIAEFIRIAKKRTELESWDQ